MRILLLGDSIIDNATYVQPGEPDVAAQVKGKLPDFEVERRAVDGSVTSDVLRNQIGDLNDDDYIILSSGGNDALLNVQVLDNTETRTSRHTLNDLWDIRSAFQSKYSVLLNALKGKQRQVLVFTIYDPAFAQFGSETKEQKAAEAGLSIFNDVIQREALSHGCDILEIRTLFNDPADYANPIEPSAQGGEKLAIEIEKWVRSRISE